MYHSIDESGSGISLDAETFAAHVRWLATNVSVVPLTQIAATSQPDAVAITFDDGFQNFADIALPLLREHGLPATVFVAADYVGKTNGWSVNTSPAVPELPLMSWDVLGQIGTQGITVGSHTRTHPHLRRVPREALHAEIVDAAEVINRQLGMRPTAFAYPYGEYDAACLRAVCNTYALACTTELRALDGNDDALQLPRLDSYYFRRPGMLEQFGAPAFRRFLWVRRHGRTVRRVLAHGGVGA
jgi:peptidoglycan/xylan/chitin deacetylase (PgdA/CDA1 family)